MRSKKPNEFGEVAKYEIDDKVRVWPIFKRPVGTVVWIYSDQAPIKYRVHYQYEDGRHFTEEFEGKDLTLVEKSYTHRCNCYTHTWEHQTWCNAYRSRL